MKNNILKLSVAILLATSALALSACQKDDNNANSENTEANSLQTTTVPKSENENTGGEFSRPEMKIPTEIVIGEVKTIGGNMVTINLAEITDEMKEKLSSFERPTNAGNLPENLKNLSQEELEALKENKPLQNEDGADKGTRPNFAGVNAGAGRPQFNGGYSQGEMNAKQDILGDTELTFTDENASYTIPIELKIGMSDYTSIAKGDILSIGLDENEEVISVMILG